MPTATQELARLRRRINDLRSRLRGRCWQVILAKHRGDEQRLIVLDQQLQPLVDHLQRLEAQERELRQQIEQPAAERPV